VGVRCTVDRDLDSGATGAFYASYPQTYPQQRIYDTSAENGLARLDSKPEPRRQGESTSGRAKAPELRKVCGTEPHAWNQTLRRESGSRHSGLKAIAPCEPWRAARFASRRRRGEKPGPAGPPLSKASARLRRAPADAAVAAAIGMLCRCGDDLKGCDTLRVLSPG
jgi:hypothetical protein